MYYIVNLNSWLFADTLAESLEEAKKIADDVATYDERDITIHEPCQELQRILQEMDFSTGSHFYDGVMNYADFNDLPCNSQDEFSEVYGEVVARRRWHYGRYEGKDDDVLLFGDHGWYGPWENE